MRGTVERCAHKAGFPYFFVRSACATAHKRTNCARFPAPDDRVQIRTRVDRIRTRKRVPFLKNCRAGPRCGRGRLASQGVATQPQVYVKIGSSGKQRHRTLENSVTPFIKILIFCNFVKYLRGILLDGFWQQKDT